MLYKTQFLFFLRKVPYVTSRHIRSILLTFPFPTVSGGQVLVHCTPLDDVISNQSQLLVLDAITDVVRYVIDTTAKPYVSPDSRYVVLISEDSNMVQVYHVTDNGKNII